MEQYFYKGPVMEFERIIANNWEATTYAPSMRKARSNLTYRFKKENNRTRDARIRLPGKLVVVEEEET